MVQIISTDKIIRSQTLIAELKQQKIDFRIIPGVIPDFEEFKQGFLHDKKFTSLLAQRDLTAGEVGCALAHRSSATNLLNSNFEFGLTFEDDAEILRNIDFEKIAKKLQSPSATVINLGWIPGYAVALNRKDQKNKDVLEVITPPTCAFAYAFNRAAAELIEFKNKKIIDFADWPINMLNKTKFFIVNSAWVSAPQDPSQSLIGVRTVTQKKTLAKLINRKFLFIISFFKLLILFKFKYFEINAKQITQRFLLRDYIYKYGIRIIKDTYNPKVENDIVFMGSFLGKLIKLLNN